MLLALGFTQLWMLGWLAAAAVPIIIHLWNKRKHREVEWAAMEYLLAALRKNARRIRIEQWLLLAVRTAIVVLAVLAVSGPYVQNLAGTFVAGEPTHKVLVIDDSFSMGYKTADQTRFDRAKQLAGQLIEQSSQGDGFTLVQMGASPRAIIPSPVFTSETVVEEIGDIKLQHGGADLPATLARAEEIVQRSTIEHPQLKHSQVYFFTDLGRNTWNAAAQADAARLAKSADVFVIDLGQSDAENLAVNSLRCEEPYATVNRPLRFEAQITNYGRQARRQQSVQWWIDGQRVREDVAEIPAGGQQTAGLEWRFDQPGNHTIEARLPGDGLEVDNHRWLSLDVRQNINVLVVNGDGSQQAARQLVSALNPDSDPQQSPIRVDVTPESALVDTELSRYDAVFLSNVAQFTPAEAQILSRYVNAGGGLVIFLGDRVQPERYNQELGGGRTGGVRLLPAKLEQPSEAAQFSLDPLQYRHPIVAEFAGNERAGLLTTPITKYSRMKPFDSEKAQPNVALTIRETGDPVIVEEAIGAGRVVLVGLPASLASVDPVTNEPWTMMPAWHSFLPLVQETLAFVLGRQAERRNVEVGDALDGDAAPGESLTVQLPGQGMHLESARITAGKDGRWSFDDTVHSGVYRVQSSSDNLESVFAVNVETGDLQGESSLQKADADDLPRELVVLKSWQHSGESQTIDLSIQTDIQRWFLYAVLVFLFTETGLAWWLSRARG